MVLLTQEILNPPAGGGKVLKKVLFGEAPPQGPTPYLLITYHFSQKMCPFRILSIDLRYPFHIPSLELCIAFTAVIALSLKCRWINHKNQKLFTATKCICWPFGTRFLPTEMTDLSTLSYTSTSEIPTLSYLWTWSLRKVPISGGASPYRPL